MNPNSNTNNRNQKDVEPLNKAIRAREVLIINEDGTRQGPINKFEALKLAEDGGMDMLQVGVQPNGVAIVKFLDYGKHKYEQKRKQKENKKNQIRTENREIRLTVGIGDHDLDVKAKKAREFLSDGDRVKVSLKFKGREIAYQEFGLNTINKFFEKVKDVAKVEKEPKLTNRFLDMYIVPSKLKSGGKNNAKNEDEKSVS
ncbi:translation initiation factor IF-3 [Spiroplasma endosymbiont of Othius punctulatus]|uniref:translation initiation factor IF-3 n=1 Tax=Spiroplasma endosymbiont of Othius punctulatus TaxID=3066289 RepID=UPI0030D07010